MPLEMAPENAAIRIEALSKTYAGGKTALDNVKVALEPMGVSDAEADSRARDWLARVGLRAFVERYPHMLSGGQRSMLVLARSLVTPAKMLFLDEPTGAMDSQTEAYFIEHLRTALTPEQTLIVSTHRHQMLSIVDRLLVIDGGRILADGPRDQVLGQLQKAAAGESRREAQA